MNQHVRYHIVSYTQPYPMKTLIHEFLEEFVVCLEAVKGFRQSACGSVVSQFYADLFCEEAV